MKKTSQQIISDTLTKERKKKGLTQTQLSMQTGINRATIGRIENFEYMPSIEQLQILTEALNIDITNLFVETNTKCAFNTNTTKKYNIAVAGTGYVGLSIATLLSQHNHVVAVDIIPEKVALINNKKSPIQDEYIEKYLSEKNLDLQATTDAIYAYKDADYVVIAAPTNYDSKKNKLKQRSSVMVGNIKDIWQKFSVMPRKMMRKSLFFFISYTICPFMQEISFF